VPTGNNATSTASTTEENGIPTLDLTSASSTISTSTTPVVADAAELVIPPLVVETETQETSHIPDILIPPLQATSSAEVR
jgi:hypothetical protein